MTQVGLIAAEVISYATALVSLWVAGSTIWILSNDLGDKEKSEDLKSAKVFGIAINTEVAMMIFFVFFFIFAVAIGLLFRGIRLKKKA
tara:strand:- start:19432 stop:19695 length:264 start_codon:yes stop_codon:yes gene_type:complete